VLDDDWGGWRWRSTPSNQHPKLFLSACLGLMCYVVQNQMKSGFMKIRKCFIEISGNISGRF